MHNVTNLGDTDDWARQEYIARFDHKAHDLPRGREKLHQLIISWLADANNQKTSHSKRWGGKFQGTRGDGSGDGEKKEKPLISLVTNWQKAHDAIADFLNVLHLPKETGLHIVDFVNVLDAAGVGYGVQKGKKRLDELRKTRSVHTNQSKECTVLAAGVSTTTKQRPKYLTAADSIPFTPAEVVQYAP